MVATTEQFAERASVADGASELFVELFGSESRPRPVGLRRAEPAPLACRFVDAIFEIEL